MTRIVLGQDAKVTSPLFVNDDEAATAADSTPTVAIVNAAGTTLTAPTVTSAGTTGRYTAALTDTAHASQLDTLTLTWTGTVGGSTRSMTQVVDVVGGRLFSVADLRAEPGLEAASTFPTSLLRDVRDECEDYAERWCSVAFNLRFTQETLYYDGAGVLRPTFGRGRTVRTITVDGTTGTASDWAFTPAGHLYPVTGGLRSGVPIVVGYTHGWDTPPPKLVRECLRWARREVLARSARATTDVLAETLDGQTTRYALPDPTMGRPTGVLALDPVLAEYSLRLLVG